MAKLERKAAAVLAAAITIAIGGPAKAEESPSTIVVHIANHANVAPKVLDMAMVRAASVFELIDVPLRWDPSGLAVSRVENGEVHFNVLLLTRDMREKTIAADGLNRNLLGYAHLPSGRAYVFPDRIWKLNGVPTAFSARLGDVIAHEVGHLLLRVMKHSSRGIMRPSLAEHSDLVQTFNRDEARTIRTALLASR